MGKKNKGKKKNKKPSSDPEFTPEELAGSRPPPWAKGRAIGLWHRARMMNRLLSGQMGPEGVAKGQAMLNREGNKKEREEKNAPGLHHIEVPPDKLAEVQATLRKIGLPAPPCVQKVRNQVNTTGNPSGSAGATTRDQPSSAAVLKERYKHVEDSPFKTKFLKTITGNIQDRLAACSGTLLKSDPALNERYLSTERSKTSSSRVRQMLDFRRKLPAWEKRHELLDALERNNVILVTGETGCGKTTQVPQFILEEALLAGKGSQTYIICTQPRRISAITVAERVASERGESLGQSVGYQIRLEKIMPRNNGSILFCTTGVLLQWMHGDPLLTKVSTVIVDEIHERNTVSDFVITILRDILPLRPDLKVVLMSATLNADRFSKYFNNCPTVHIPGFTYNVEEYYLEDILETIPHDFGPPKKRSSGKKTKRGQMSQLSQEEMLLDAFYRDISGRYSRNTIESLKNPESNEINLPLTMKLVEHICVKMGPGAILVFLPGWDKISTMNKMLTQSGKFPGYRYRIIPLHSLMPTTNQKIVFERPPPGVRKIILATNIAETSITIDDVVYVVDCGKIKMSNFDVDSNVSTLKEEWVSLANARQRRGRAGRVQEGVCFHMYSRGREMLLERDMLPEMLRTRLEEVILQGKILQLGKMGTFLKKVMDPPSEKAVELSIEMLTDMNALDGEENLTPLGYHLASLPVDPQAGKMLLFAAIFGLLDPISSVAAVMSFKDPFVIPLGQEREVDRIRQSFDANHKSDHLITAKIIAQYEDATVHGDARKFASVNFMSQNVLNQLRDMKKQLVSLLHDMKFAPNSRPNSKDNNVNSVNISLVRAMVCAGLFPNVAFVKKCKKIGQHGNSLSIAYATDGTRVTFHPKSIFYTNSQYLSKFVVYFEKLRSSSVFLFDSTMVYPLSLVFFCHDLKVHNKPDHKVIEVCRKVSFTCSIELANVIVELRAWLDWLLEYRMCHPGLTDWSPDNHEGLILNAVVDLVTAEEEAALVAQKDALRPSASVFSQSDSTQNEEGYDEENEEDEEYDEEYGEGYEEELASGSVPDE